MNPNAHPRRADGTPTKGRLGFEVCYRCGSWLWLFGTRVEYDLDSVCFNVRGLRPPHEPSLEPPTKGTKHQGEAMTDREIVDRWLDRPTAIVPPEVRAAFDRLQSTPVKP